MTEAGAPARWSRIVVVANPNAGAKAGLPTNRSGGDVVREALERHGVQAEIVEGADEDEARRLARSAAADGADLVVAAGGDGTVGLVATELLETGVALGILPLGSIMNIARSLGVPRDLDAAVRILYEGEPRAVDVGEVNGKPFYEAGSVGLNAALFREAAQVDAGHFAGLWHAIKLLLRFRPARMRITLDDGVIRERALMVVAANGPYTGFGFTVAPDALLDDGRFDVCIFSRFSRTELVRHFVSIAVGRRAYSPKVRLKRSGRVRVDAYRRLPCRADSVDHGTTPVEFAVRPRALRVVVPRPAADEAAEPAERPALKGH